MTKPRARFEYNLWLVRGDGAAGCAIELGEAYRRWLAQRWLLHEGIALVTNRADWASRNLKPAERPAFETPARMMAEEQERAHEDENRLLGWLTGRGPWRRS